MSVSPGCLYQYTGGYGCCSVSVCVMGSERAGGSVVLHKADASKGF